MWYINLTPMCSDLGSVWNNRAIFLFRFLVSAELIVVHGLKKIGVGIAQAEVVPNPFGLPDAVNQILATGANLICPLFVILGFFTRLAAIPIVAVTLTGYFVVHGNDSLAERDIPFMFSVAFLFIVAVGGGRYSLDHNFFNKLK